MRLLSASTVLLSLCTAVPAFSQNALLAAADITLSANVPTAAPTANPAEVDLSTFHQEIADKNKALADHVSTEKVVVHKNEVIMRDARKIDAANKKLDVERKQLDAQNEAFDRQRRQMLAELTETARPQQIAPSALPMQTSPQPARTVVASASDVPVAPTLKPRIVDAAPQSLPASESGVKYAVNLPPHSTASVVADLTAPSMAIAPRVAPPAVTQPAAQPASVASVPNQQMILTSVRPTSPQTAASNRSQNTVVVDAVISKTGAVKSVRAVSGPITLQKAAMDAVKDGKYQPYFVNNQPIEVQATIQVAFKSTR